MNTLALLIILIFLALPIETTKCQCQKAEDDTPALGTLFVSMNGGRVKNLQGVILSPDGKVMKDAIVEVFENRSKAEDENISGAEVSQSSGLKRKAACLTAENGEFCFTNLPPGRYLLRAGHRSDGQFSAVYVVVTLDPHGKSSSNEGLRAELAVSI